MKRFLFLFILTFGMIGFTGTLSSAEDAENQEGARLEIDLPDEETTGSEDVSEGEITYSATPGALEDISVIEARICEGIVDREPVAPGDVFSSGITPLFCFCRISSPQSTEIKHIWYFDGQPVAEIPLSIGSSTGWRTFSSKTIRPMDKGHWKVEIVTASGLAVKTIQFLVN